MEPLDPLSTMSLKLRLRVLVWGAILFSVLISISFFYWRQSQWYQQQKEEGLITSAELLSEQSVVSIQFDDTDALQEILGSVAIKSDIAGALIIDPQSNILAFVPENMSMPMQMRLRTLAWVKSQNGEQGFTDSEEYIKVISQDEEALGTLILMSDMAPLSRQRWQLFQTALIVMVLVPLIVSFLLRRLRHSLLKPILELSDVAQEVIRDQNFKLRVREDRSDELGAMGKSFNAMMAVIEEKSQQLEDSKNSLERLVQDRTQALDAANQKLQEELEERMKISDKLLEAKEKAEASDVAKSEFLSVMTHEIRTPMSGIIGMAELLEKSKLEGSQKEYVKYILSSAHQQLKIIGSILDFTKIEAGEYQFLLQPMDLREVIEDSAVQIAPKLAKKGLDFFVDFAPDVPDQVIGDSSVLQQIMMNLLNNAFKFTKKGHLALRVDYLGREGQQILLSIEVEDSGIGIAEEKVDHVFERFTQADSSTSRKYGGTGLGLTICKNLVELMNGSIELSSEEGVGSTFKVELLFELAEREGIQIEDEDLQGLAYRVESENEEVIRLCDQHMMAVGMHKCLSNSELIEHSRKSPGYCLKDLHGIDFKERDLAVRDEVERWQGTGVRLVLLSDFGDEAEFWCERYARVVWVLHRPLFRLQSFQRFVQQSVLLDQLSLETLDEVKERSGDPSEDSKALTLEPLDLKEKTVQAEEDDSKEIDAEAKASPYRGMQLLVVEDDDVNLMVLESLLDELGCSYTSARDGREAYEFMQQGHPVDLIFMDCMMPDMDGYEATRAIRALDAPAGEVCIVALTANASKQDQDKCLDSGMDDYLMKPIHEEKLVEILGKWLSEGSSSMHLAESNSGNHLAEGNSGKILVEGNSGNHLAEGNSGNHLAEGNSDNHLAEDNSGKTLPEHQDG